jgi:hypothetical protein
MKTIKVNRGAIDAGVYVSVLCLYNMVQEPYKDCEVGDRYFYSMTHYANSIDDADKKAKVYFANEIFKDDEIEIFGVHSIKVTVGIIEKILSNHK